MTIEDRAKLDTHDGGSAWIGDFGCWRTRLGAGRWIYCDYCNQTVRPERLVEVNSEGIVMLGRPVLVPYVMVVCSVCDAGLTPSVPVGADWWWAGPVTEE